jgi:hypothetical protein
MFPDYRIEVFEELLARDFTIVQRETLPSGSRTLFFVRAS